MAQQQLDRADVGSVFQHMDRKGMAKRWGVMGLEMWESLCAS